jgi:hypothetical protein
MPRRNRHKKSKGGDLTNWWSDNVSNSSWLNRSKSYIPSWMSGNNSQNNSTGMNFGSTGSNYGGKSRTKRKYGGYVASNSIVGLAANAGPVSGLLTAKPHTLVGGKTKRHRHKHSRTCKH